MSNWTAEEEYFLLSHLDKPNIWISSQINRSPNAISKRTQKMGIKKIYNQLKHEDKSTTFSDKEMGYCLGVFASDGCLTIKRNSNGSLVKRFALTLGIKDLDWLLSIFKLLTGEIVDYEVRPPSLGKTNKVAYYSTLKSFIKSAEDFGITRNKSKTLDVNLDGKSIDFKYYFLRGVIDGDGHIPIKSGKIVITSASIKFMETLDRNFSGSVIKRTGKYWDLKENYWDFRLNYSEEKMLPKEAYMLLRKTKRMNDRLSSKTIKGLL